MTRPSVAGLLASWTLEPSLLVVVLAASVLYLRGTRRTRRRWPRGRTLSFHGGLIVLSAALCSGIDRESELLLSIHMVQHLLLLLLAPLLLLGGAPLRLTFAACGADTRRGLARLLRGRVGRVLGRPAAGFVVFATVVLATHLTGVFELALRNQTVHAVEHAAYFWSGTLFLAPLVGADPLPHRPSGLARFSWLMAAMVVMAIPGVLLSFSSSLWYPFYAAPARALHVSALADQQLAGAIMWIGGGIAMFALALTVAMRAMLEEERRQRRRDLYVFAQSGEGLAR